MSEPKWTPGPWYAVKFWDGRNQIRARVGHREVVVANDVSPGDVPLILAVHDMREACEAALHALAVAKDRATVLGDTLRNMGAPDQNRLQFETLMNRTADRIEAALRKARGEE